MNGIEALKKTTITELNTIYEFKMHTAMAYRQFDKYAGDRFYSVSFLTHNTFGKNDIVALYKDYENNFLPALSFQHNVNIFEAFFFDFLRLLLRNNPDLIGCKKQIDVKTVLSISGRTELIDFIIDRELNELKYQKIADWFTYLNKALKCAPANPEEIQHIAEIKASRDILVHNSGLVNATYVSKAGLKGRYADGEQLEITQKYFYESWQLTKKLVQSMCDAAISKE